ncbi:MAG: right-handed parallel beta-helix repeat-containing protein [Lentisphaeraceae bacterium]|nr:right-handed parallel beta-helix repeat-containing protein [Lentisphaeraceae bacterium]
MRLFCLFLSLIMFFNLQAREYKARDSKSIKKALLSAKAGDVITVKPGEYDMGDTFATGKDGTEKKPIILQCSGEKGYAVLKVSGQVGFRIKSKFWVIKGVHTQGSESKTQATVFMDGPGGAGNIKMIDCKISGSALHGMKSAAKRDIGVHNIYIENTELYDTAFTGFDIVSGNNWVIKNCYVHDYGKQKGVSYGIFLKGGGKNGIIDGCFVDGKASSTTVGISFGGGLTGEQWLPLIDGKIAPEHFEGIARNNIVVNTTDVAYHSNNASNCHYYNNLAWNCKNFQRQKSYPDDPRLFNNLIAGKYRGVHSDSDNNINELDAKWFVDPEKNDFRLSKEGIRKLKRKAVKSDKCPSDMFGQQRKDLYPGPVLPGAKQSTKWVDRRE